MPFLSSFATSTGRAAIPIDLLTVGEARGARGDAARSLREDNWENEGGRVAAAKPRIATPALSASDVETLDAQVRRMESTLATDFANGRMGRRYNTFAHRSRVIRQQKAKLESLRASFLTQERSS